MKLHTWKLVQQLTARPGLIITTTILTPNLLPNLIILLMTPLTMVESFRMALQRAASITTGGTQFLLDLNRLWTVAARITGSEVMESRNVGI
jgi:hypothetical protein